MFIHNNNMYNNNLKFQRMLEGWHLKESKRVKSHYSEVTLKYEVIHS